VASDSAAEDPGGGVRVHLYVVYVPVPPDGTASRWTRVPVVPEFGAVIDTASAVGGSPLLGVALTSFDAGESP